MLLRLLLIMLMLTPAGAFAAPTILVYGDSLSAAYGMATDESWVHLLQQRLQQSGYSHVVVNASISGETTSGGLSRIEKTLLMHRPALVILELGANDGLRGLPIIEMRRNLTMMIDACRRHRTKVLLVGMRLPPNYGPRYATAFMESYPLLARQQKLPLLEFLLDGVAGRPQLTQDDGLHPTAAAQPRLLDNVWPRLTPLLAKPVNRGATR
jgi:acyl-CoA thioesterase I